MPALPDTLTSLQQRILREIILYIRQSHMPEGTHLTASNLASQLDVSRSPVNIALQHLASMGVVIHDRNRGYFLAVDAEQLGEDITALVQNTEDPLYLKLVDMRLAREIPEQILESDVMRLLEASRSTVSKLLARVQEEGWIERRAGQGWEFLPMIDSKEAYEESYIYRLAIEPAGLLSPSFKVDRKELENCLRQQEFIAAKGYLSMSPYELFEANCHFHEALALWSNNRFLHQSLVRLNKLRRLVEYRQASQRSPRRDQALEHVEILSCIAQGDQIEAAGLLRQHLNAARRGKMDSVS